MLTAAVLVSACSGDTPADPAGSESPSGSPAATPGDVIEAYFTAMVDQQPAGMMRQSVPGSPAARFAGYWRNGLNAGDLAERELVSTSDSEAVVKRVDNGDVTTYQAFVFDEQTGLLKTWSAKPGGSLRIVSTPKAGRVTPLKVSVREQYVSGQDLTIAVVARNDNRQAVSLAGQTYVAPNGRSVSVNNAVTVPPRSKATALFSADRARLPGGRLTLYTFPRDGGVTIATTTLKLPAK